MIKNIEHNILYAWHLLVGKQAALKHMMFGREAVQHSWYAVLLAVPFLVLNAFAGKVSGPVIAEMAKIKNYVVPSLAMTMVIAVAAWIIGIMVQRSMAVLLGRKNKADVIVVVNNWLRLLINFIGAPISLLVAVHWLSPSIALFIGFCLSVYMLALITWINGIILDVSWWRASAITLAVLSSEFVVIQSVYILSGGAKP